MFLFKWFVSGVLIGLVTRNAIAGFFGGLFIAVIDSVFETKEIVVVG